MVIILYLRLNRYNLTGMLPVFKKLGPTSFSVSPGPWLDEHACTQAPKVQEWILTKLL